MVTSSRQIFGGTVPRIVRHTPSRIETQNSSLAREITTKAIVPTMPTTASVMKSGAACAAESCLAILEDGSSTGDGTYYVDFDGSATAATCDMSSDGGGWTLIFADDFESSVDSGWDLSSTYDCGSFGRLLGGYGIISGGTINNTVTTYSIPHSEGWMLLEYAALDSWDGETAYVQADGSTLWSQSQNNHSSSYGEVCGWDRGYYGSYDSLHSIDATFSHSASAQISRSPGRAHGVNFSASAAMTL